ncbi:hypothetical protein X566_17645 [Afipia sp. P52-10]|uniref:hypothetical protein n=1 Tax=Afipia sp. P52-10 TaxID=1429916 RepID=UPI0003DF0CEE|nr:hypothetical protein [Afipia sp. P52-10]ETR76361.1 hypothetical protein X566_17645 [Afipia sp. P52-10]
MTPDTATPVSYRTNELAIPERLRPFAEPALIAGESREDYELLRQLLIEDIQPQSNLEWLWLFDLAELSWEILRYRKLKVRTIEMHRVKAIEALLLQIDGAGLPDNDPVLLKHARINAVECRTNPSTMREIEARLASHKLDHDMITAATLVQAHSAVMLFEALVRRAQERRVLFARRQADRPHRFTD